MNGWIDVINRTSRACKTTFNALYIVVTDQIHTHLYVQFAVNILFNRESTVSCLVYAMHTYIKQVSLTIH